MGVEVRLQGFGVPNILRKIEKSGGFPKSRGTFLGVFEKRIVAFWGQNCGPPTLGNYHVPIQGASIC